MANCTKKRVKNTARNASTTAISGCILVSGRSEEKAAYTVTRLCGLAGHISSNIAELRNVGQNF